MIYNPCVRKYSLNSFLFFYCLSELMTVITDMKCDWMCSANEANHGCFHAELTVFFQHLSERVAMYVHAYTLYSAVRPFGCRWVQILSSHLSMLYLVTTHTIHWKLRSGETRGGMMTDCGFAHWTEPQWCRFSWLSDLSLCPRAWAHSNALLAFKW